MPLGDRHNMVFSGTAATYGHGRAIVTATGMRTEMGRIAGLLKQTPDEPTPLQRELDRTGKRLGVVVLAIAVVMIATILLVQDVRGAAAIFDVLILGVALAVAAVPEGLPAVVTVVLSIGVQRMARRHAIVRHLAAVETLGSATVIASDKTGTLTKNEMTVRVAVTASGRVAFDGTGYAPEGSVRREGGGDIDGPLRIELDRALRRRQPRQQRRRARARRTVDRPRRPHRRRAAGRRGQGRRRVGGARPAAAARRRAAVLVRAQADEHRAPRHRAAIAAWCSPRARPTCCWRAAREELVGDGTRPLTPERRAEILAVNEALAGEALRTLGVAARPLTPDALAEHTARPDERLEQDLAFIGLIGIIDPPRPEAKDAVARARRAGIRPLMITGDHPRTAAVIARELGIATDGRDAHRRRARRADARRRRRAPSPRCRSTPA